MKRIGIIFLLLFWSAVSFAQREVFNLNRSWEFVPGWEVQKDKSTTINLPHTWNLDALSGKWDYFRGLGNYVKMVDIPSSWKDKRVYLRCKGANQTTDVYINSKHIGQHKGGYTAFAYDITPYITAGSKNSIWFRVTNALDLDVMPLLGDFNFYGGVYRDVELIVTPNVHIAADYYASSGVIVRTTGVSHESAKISVTTKVSTSSPSLSRVQFMLFNQSDSLIENVVKTVKLNEKGEEDVSANFVVSNPHLWNSVKDPYLYRVAVTVQEISEKSKIKPAKDSISEHVGLRYFEVDKDNQFYLNGEKFQVQGVGRHQDWAMLGNAIFKENHEKDIELMLEMGVNAVRLAHYPQDPYFIELCDKAGILVWSEIPFVGPGGYRDKGFNDSQAFMDNGENQLLEMINQLGNHPSIIWWGLFNELNQRGDDPVNYVKRLNTIAKEEDPTRITVAASNQDGQLNFITDLIGFNQYFGWYGGEPTDIKTWATSLRKDWPNLKAGISEYGAGGSIYQHSDTLTKSVPNSYWHPEQWQTHYHEAHWRAIKEGNFFWGTFVWAMFDFGAAHRTEGLRPGINDKGLVTFDRRVGKDAFYFYKANWNTTDQFVYIAERRWQNRPQKVQTIKVFSNCPNVELFVNGVSFGLQSNDGFGTFVWKSVPMTEGNNTVEAYSNSAFAPDSINVTINSSNRSL